MTNDIGAEVDCPECGGDIEYDNGDVKCAECGTTVATKGIPEREADPDAGGVPIDEVQQGELVVTEFVSKFNGEHQLKVGVVKDVDPGPGWMIIGAQDDHKYRIHIDGHVTREEDNLDYATGARVFATVPVDLSRHQ